MTGNGQDFLIDRLSMAFEGYRLLGGESAANFYTLLSPKALTADPRDQQGLIALWRELSLTISNPLFSYIFNQKIDKKNVVGIYAPGTPVWIEYIYPGSNGGMDKRVGTLYRPPNADVPYTSATVVIPADDISPWSGRISILKNAPKTINGFWFISPYTIREPGGPDPELSYALFATDNDGKPTIIEIKELAKNVLKEMSVIIRATYLMEEVRKAHIGQRPSMQITPRLPTNNGHRCFLVHDASIS